MTTTDNLPYLLFIHGFPLDRSMWQPQLDGLADVAHVIAPDLPGFGGVPATEPTTTMDAMADACAAALDEAGARTAVICGLSMGGYVALAFWRRHRERVGGLVLANTRAGADDAAGRERRSALAERVRREGVEFLAAAPPPLFSAHAPFELYEWARKTIAAQPPEGVAAGSLGMGARPNATDLLASIDVPTLVITGSDDTLIPPDATREMADSILVSDFRVIEGAGHLSNLEAPAAFNELLRRHLHRCGAVSIRRSQ